MKVRPNWKPPDENGKGRKPSIDIKREVKTKVRDWSLMDVQSTGVGHPRMRPKGQDQLTEEPLFEREQKRAQDWKPKEALPQSALRT